MSDTDATPSYDLSDGDIAAAERLLGLEFTEAERSQLLARVAEHLEGYQTVRTIPIGNEVPHALHGPDGYDLTVVEAPFGWPLKRNLSDLTIG